MHDDIDTGIWRTDQREIMFRHQLRFPILNLVESL